MLIIDKPKGLDDLKCFYQERSRQLLRKIGFTKLLNSYVLNIDIRVNKMHNK